MVRITDNTTVQDNEYPVRDADGRFTLRLTRDVGGNDSSPAAKLGAIVRPVEFFRIRNEFLDKIDLVLWTPDGVKSVQPEVGMTFRVKVIAQAVAPGALSATMTQCGLIDAAQSGADLVDRVLYSTQMSDAAYKTFLPGNEMFLTVDFVSALEAQKNWEEAQAAPIAESPDEHAVDAAVDVVEEIAAPVAE